MRILNSLHSTRFIYLWMEMMNLHVQWPHKMLNLVLRLHSSFNSADKELSVQINGTLKSTDLIKETQYEKQNKCACGVSA